MNVRTLPATGGSNVHPCMVRTSTQRKKSYSIGHFKILDPCNWVPCVLETSIEIFYGPRTVKFLVGKRGMTKTKKARMLNKYSLTVRYTTINYISIPTREDLMC